MKKKRSSVLQKLDSNFKSKLENLFGGRITKKVEKPNTNEKKKKRKFKLRLPKNTNNTILPMPPLPPPPVPENNFNIEAVQEIKIEEIDDIVNNKTKTSNNENNNEKNEKNENRNEKPIEQNKDFIYTTIIEKLITLNSHLIDREIEKMKHYKKHWWDIEHKSFLFGVVTSLLSFLISYLI